MNKELFEKYMNSLIEFDDFIHDLYDMDINIVECDVIMNFMTNYINILEDACGDSTTNWISYWLYELDRGANWEPGCVTDDNGNEIKLETLDDLYELLVENMKNDTN